jgi:hypothetical protein
MNLWQLVEHNRANLKELTREVAGSIGTKGVKTRHHLFRELEREVERYLEAMEEVVHPALANDERARSDVAELEHEHEEIRRFMRDLAAVEPKDTPTWTRRFQALILALDNYFSLQQRALMAGRSTLEPHADALRRAFEREQIASLLSQRRHVPKPMVPERYGVSIPLALSTIVGVLGLAFVAAAWRRRPALRDLTAQDVHERSQANRAFREENAAWLH